MSVVLPTRASVDRRLVVVSLITLIVIGVGMPRTLSPGHPQGLTENCVRPSAPVRIGDTVACAHDDAPPPGVDVTARPSTSDLQSRPGAGPAAYAAAADLGVPTPAQAATTAAGPAVTCDGDGSSGYRIQAMYVVEAGHTNRYASLLSSFRIWAAGVDDVVNRSAALTGGVRHLRYVTVPASGGCVADVLDVTVPAGSLATFGATVAAVQALGYTSPARKYLMWTDATTLCGVASLYNDDSPGQGNDNNGLYPQYARIDSSCWGLGDGSDEHSAEAHELMHTLGAVQNSAPHSTKAGHCWDESDTMCYADGGSHAMKQVCPLNMEYFYDCNNDDYFSTYPQSGNYLATHWNTADSRFLIGGGNGTTGGALGTPKALGATLAVNNPAVPGLSTQASVAPQLPAGRTLRTVAWTSARSDCVFATPTAVQSAVTCAATSSTATTITATLTDSTGATTSVAGPLSFASGTARPVAVQLEAADQSTTDGSTASVCNGSPFGLTGTVVDVASGSPVKGLSVAVSTQSTGLLANLGKVLSSLLGVSTLTQSITTATTYAAGTTAGTVYAAGASPELTAVPSTCATALTSTASASATYYGDPVTVSGRLTRVVGSRTVPVPGLALPVRLASVVSGVTQSTTLGTATTSADGTYSLVVRPTATGQITTEVPASAGYVAEKATAGSVVVSDPGTHLAATLDKDDVGYCSTITVTGRLDRVGSSTTPLAGAGVVARVIPSGKAAVTVATGTVATDGTFTVPVALKLSGDLEVSYAGTTGQPAQSIDLDSVRAGAWATHLTAAASSMSLSATGPAGATTVTGTVSKTYEGTTLPAPGLKISFYLTPGGSVIRSLLGSATTSSTGTFTAKVAPKRSGSLLAVLAAITGYSVAASDPFAFTAR
jgi:hypothetical protein